MISYIESDTVDNNDNNQNDNFNDINDDKNNNKINNLLILHLKASRQWKLHCQGDRYTYKQPYTNMYI
jgi:hypothetical protein